MKKTKMLKKNYEFRYILTKGKYYSGEYIEAFIKKNKQNLNLLGIAISVKAGKAVKRNHLKRLIRENYSHMEEELKTGNNIVFLLKKKIDISEIDFLKVKKDLEKILKKAGIFEEKNEKDID